MSLGTYMLLGNYMSLVSSRTRLKVVWAAADGVIIWLYYLFNIWPFAICQIAQKLAKYVQKFA